MSHKDMSDKTRVPIFTRLWRKIGWSLAGFTTKVLIRGVLPLLHIEQSALLKESINRVGILDYPDKDIFMQVDTQLQIARLGACKKEPETVRWIKSYLRPGEVFYDIGANVGAYSFIAHAATGGNCQVYAFEPSFSTFTALCQNVYLNRCQDQIIPLQLALSAETKMFTFKYIGLTPGDAYHALGKSVNDNDDIPARDIDVGKLKRKGRDIYVADHGEVYIRPVLKQSILCYRLDDLICEFNLAHPNHIKLDVDGSELDVLKGAEKTLGHPDLHSIAVEIDPQQRDEIVGYLTKRGFRVEVVQSAELGYRPRTVNNVFFVRDNSQSE